MLDGNKGVAWPSQGSPAPHMLRDVLPHAAHQPTNIRGSRPCYAFVSGMKCRTAPAPVPAQQRFEVHGLLMCWALTCYGADITLSIPGPPQNPHIFPHATLGHFDR
ncbi:hypothetical protein SLA2020_143350 [Shorea laevis]